MSELHREAPVGIILDVHDFSVVGQDEKLTASAISTASFSPLRSDVWTVSFLPLSLNIQKEKREKEEENHRVVLISSAEKL